VERVHGKIQKRRTVMINATKTELALAFQKWNKRFLENKFNFDDEKSGDLEYAERQAGELVDALNEVQGGGE